MAVLSAARGPAPIDAITRVFVLAMAVATVADIPRLAAWPWLLAGDVLVLLLLALLARAPDASRLGSVVALWYPVLLVLTSYAQLGVMGLGVAHLRDPVVQGWEAALFGGQPSVAWHQAVASPTLSTVLHACYAAHYLIITGIPLWLWARAGRAACERALFGIALAFYVCYLVSAVFPVAGPRYVFPSPAGPEAAVAPARLVRGLLEAGSSYGTAFPSSHVAASWCAVLVGLRDARKVALVVAPVAVGLAAGTVYGQFHYLVDVLAGAVVALGCFALTDPLRRRLATTARP
jgi:membrane-associated phospholipid phosphatase